LEALGASHILVNSGSRLYDLDLTTCASELLFDALDGPRPPAPNDNYRIFGITGVPEPHAGLLAVVALLGMPRLLRRIGR
jgi:hypothetical protein